MNIEVQPGRYVVAVSGGVDSVVLLHLLQQIPDVHIIVAHYDHGIRSDSLEDREFVQALAARYDVPFTFEAGQLGSEASEATAREARYAFLHSVRKAHDATAIITAHHQDDVIETAILNILRGTGRKGLSSLQSTGDVLRPLLDIPKTQLIDYAKAHAITWREDSTNSEQKYKRNYVRHAIVAKLTPDQRAQFLVHITRSHHLNHSLDTLLINQLHMQSSPNALDRAYFVLLPHDISKEVLATWLRGHGVRDFDKKGLQRMTVAAKTYMPGRKIDTGNNYTILVTENNLALELRDR